MAYGRAFCDKIGLSCVLLLLFGAVLGEVDIIKPYHPLYVKVGDPLTIKCISSNLDLEWVRSTGETTWDDSVIQPTYENGWVIRTTKEEPSGFVESVLIKKKITLQDRGTYTCRDVKNIESFSVWVTALQVYTENVTAKSGQKSIGTWCILTGFDINPPAMVHTWYFKKNILPIADEKYSSHVNESEQNRMYLQLKNPYKEDTGWYECTFTLETNISPLDISQKVYIDTTQLPSTANELMASSKVWIVAVISLITLLMQTKL